MPAEAHVHEHPRSVAVFVDFENLLLEAGKVLSPAGSASVPYRVVGDLCRRYGRVTVQRAYADWSRDPFTDEQEQLAVNGVELVQVARFGCRQKNAADVRIAVDAMETLHRHPDVHTFVLVSGDGDFSPLVQRLREHGRTVVGVAPGPASSDRLQAVCSEFVRWEDLLGPDLRSGDDLRRPELELLLAALASAGDPAAWVPASAVKTRMLALDPAFDQKRCGASTFGRFLALPSIAAHVETSRDGLRLSVRRRTVEAA